MTWQPEPGGLDVAFQTYSETTAEDQPFFQADIAGTIAHVLGLQQVGLLPAHEVSQLVTALQRLAADGLQLDPRFEDVHMNIEAAITGQLGDLGKKLHTGRSRNDQVATAITIVARQGIAEAAHAACLLVEALTHQAAQHMETPWTAKTHLQPAQPATIGFLLTAHATRLQDQVVALLTAFDTLDESPLGSGAVAGSTLPLDPAYTAALLALAPPRNALLATGSRDAAKLTANAAAATGEVVASLCSDLLELFAAGQLELPPGTTTGSSLMPQKRNPDLLELARGKARALAGPAAAIQAVTSGLGLGYMRDFQVTKPHLVAAIRDLTATLRILASTTPGMAFFGAPWPEGITATDEAEALVASGTPFRDAYHAIAAKAQAAATGTPTEWLAPNPDLRATRGGPAPVAVRAQIDALFAHGADLAAACQEALAEAQVPFDLLTGAPEVAV